MEHLGYVEALLSQDNIPHDLQSIDEALFYQLAPYFFITKDTKEPYVASLLRPTRADYKRFKALLEREGSKCP